jgi:hypothetical protein
MGLDQWWKQDGRIYIAVVCCGGLDDGIDIMECWGWRGDELERVFFGDDCCHF